MPYIALQTVFIYPTVSKYLRAIHMNCKNDSTLFLRALLPKKDGLLRVSSPLHFYTSSYSGNTNPAMSKIKRSGKTDDGFDVTVWA